MKPADLTISHRERAKFYEVLWMHTIQFGRADALLFALSAMRPMRPTRLEHPIDAVYYDGVNYPVSCHKAAAEFSIWLKAQVPQ